MEINAIVNALRLALGVKDAKALETANYSSWTHLIYQGDLIRGFRLLPAGPCIVVEYDVTAFSFSYDRDVKAYGFLMYIKHTMEQLFECVPFPYEECKSCFNYSIVDFKSDYKET